MAHWKKLLPIFGISVLGLLLYRIGLNNIWSVLDHLHWHYLLLFPITVSSMLAVQTWKWHVILQKQQIKISFRKLYIIQLMSAFYGTITPGRVGSLLKISYLSEQTKRPARECSISVIIDKVLDLIALISFATVGCIVSLSTFGISMLIIIVALALALIWLLLMLTDNRWAKTILTHTILTVLPGRLRTYMEIIIQSFYGITLPTRFLMVPLSLTFLSWFISYSQIYLIAVALSMKVNFIPFIFLIAIGSLVGLLPLSISGLGTRETALIILLTPWGVTHQAVMAMSLLGVLICSYFPALIGGGFALFVRRKLYNSPT